MAFVGLDTDEFPGIAAMAAVKAETNAVWTGFYLTAPSHSKSGWAGTCANLLAMGWGFAPIYVGQQTEGPGSHLVTAAQGTLDGIDCAYQMGLEGFPAGSRVFLDLENGGPFSPPQSDYVAAWVAAIQSAGYSAGVYCSHEIAQDVALANSSAQIWAFKVETTARSSAASPFPDPEPSGSGYAEAAIWQRQQNVQISGAGFSFVADLDTATTADPSAPVVTLQVQPDVTQVLIPDPVPLAQVANRPPIFATPPKPSAPKLPVITPKRIAITIGAVGATAATGAASQMNAHDIVNFAPIINAVIIPSLQAIGIGVATWFGAWLLNAASAYFKIPVTTATAQAFDAILQNSINYGVQKLGVTLDANSSVDVKNAVVAEALTFAQPKAINEMKTLGITPASLSDRILARLPAPPTTGTTP